jgi:hypothetical protein
MKNALNLISSNFIRIIFCGTFKKFSDIINSLWDKIARVKERQRPGRSYKREVKSFRNSKNHEKYRRKNKNEAV